MLLLSSYFPSGQIHFRFKLLKKNYILHWCKKNYKICKLVSFFLLVIIFFHEKNYFILN
jgi:hypothetical protein